MFIPRTLLVLVVALSFGGCVSAPKIDADKAAAAQIKRIAMLGVHEPGNVSVVNIGGAAMGFGLVGGLIQGSINADHSKQFVDAVKQRKLSFSEPMEAALTAALKADGYDVAIDRAQKPKLAADGKSDDYSDVRVDADAILTVWFGMIGYMSEPRSVHYEPWVVIKARLLDAKTKQDIYYKTFCVGYRTRIKNAVTLPADPKFRYSSFDELMSHNGDAAAGLVDCEELVARQISSDLKVR